MKLIPNEEKCILALPRQTDAAVQMLELSCADGCQRIALPLAQTRVDSWQYCRVSDRLFGSALELTAPGNDGFLCAAELLTNEQYVCRSYQPDVGVHYILPFGDFARLDKVCVSGAKRQLCFNACQDASQELVSCIVSADNGVFFHAAINEALDKALPCSSPCEDVFVGDVLQGVKYTQADGVQCAISVCRAPNGEMYLSSARVLRDGNTSRPHPQLEQLRMWQRKWHLDGKSISCPLRFSYKPSHWPNIEITEAAGMPDEVFANAYEVSLLLPEGVRALHLELPWACLAIDLQKRELDCDGRRFPISENESLRRLNLIFDATALELSFGGAVYIISSRPAVAARKAVDNSVSGNLERCAIDSFARPEMKICADKDEAVDIEITAYGLRGIEYSSHALQALSHVQGDGRIIYECAEFTLYSDRVEDASYDLVGACAVSDGCVVSPTRVIEEFEWRDSPWGDMTRADGRGDVWHASSALGIYPALRSSAVCLDAAWNIALDVFEKCASSDYALFGQNDMWSAGLFQGRGEGFGVWMRDSAHVALRGGSLIDPETCIRTLSYAAKKGFDNGSDGPAMLITALWDYYLASGQRHAIFDLMPLLLENAAEIDTRWDAEAGLVRAAQSTSNDAFPEPENAGFALGSECYFMRAYEAMAEMGRVAGLSTAQIAHWQGRADILRCNIRKMYYNESCGFFTSGPRGSQAYAGQVWESSGVEAALWGKFSIADKGQIASTLSRLSSAAMSPYGIVLFPNRSEKNHFVGPVWPVWQAGFASAAAKLGDEELVLRLISQQVRNALLNKSFYEVLESDSGKVWRWPGQLWHAAGFISLVLYGLFGIEYDKSGMRLTPCVPRQLASPALYGLRYREARLNIRIEGCGTNFVMCLDGQEIDTIPLTLSGTHELLLLPKKEV